MGTGCRVKMMAENALNLILLRVCRFDFALDRTAARELSKDACRLLGVLF